MRPTTRLFALSGLVTMALAVPVAAAAADACAMLSQADVSAALGIPVKAGTPINDNALTCQWFGTGRFATLTIRQEKNGHTPVDQFNTGKNGMPGITIEPVSGVGSDAFYIYVAGTDHAGLGLVVEKGPSVFEVRVYGFAVAQAKPVALGLAQKVTSQMSGVAVPNRSVPLPK